MKSIPRKLALALGLAAAAAFTASSAMAESVVKVPFNFVAGGKSCPAGVYTLNYNSEMRVVTLRSADASRAFSWLTAPGDPAPSDMRLVLSFDHWNNSYALRTIQYQHVITGKLDREVPEFVPETTIKGQ